VAPQPSGWKAEDKARDAGDRARRQKSTQNIYIVSGAEDGRRVGADRQEAVLTERNLSGSSHQQVQADCDDCECESFRGYEKPINLLSTGELQGKRKDRCSNHEDEEDAAANIGWTRCCSRSATKHQTHPLCDNNIAGEITYSSVCRFLYLLDGSLTKEAVRLDVKNKQQQEKNE
jgi:hypothetical protein